MAPYEIAPSNDELEDFYELAMLVTEAQSDVNAYCPLVLGITTRGRELQRACPKVSIALLPSPSGRGLGEGLANK
jgi:hypothetical protein